MYMNTTMARNSRKKGIFLFIIENYFFVSHGNYKNQNILENGGKSLQVANSFCMKCKIFIKVNFININVLSKFT